MKHYIYKPPKFYTENAAAGFNTSVLVNRYEPYGGGGGPIRLNSSTPLNGLVRIGTSELMEDIKLPGHIKYPLTLKTMNGILIFKI